MRSHEQRVAAVKERIAQRERQRRKRRPMAVAAFAAASLFLVLGLSFLVSSFEDSSAAGPYIGYETAASVFHSSGTAGYIVVGILAIILGVCVTVFCFRLRKLEEKEESMRDDHDRDL